MKGHEILEAPFGSRAFRITASSDQGLLRGTYDFVQNRRFRIESSDPQHYFAASVFTATFRRVKKVTCWLRRVMPAAAKSQAYGWLYSRMQCFASFEKLI